MGAMFGDVDGDCYEFRPYDSDAFISDICICQAGFGSMYVGFTTGCLSGVVGDIYNGLKEDCFDCYFSNNCIQKWGVHVDEVNNKVVGIEMDDELWTLMDADDPVFYGEEMNNVCLHGLNLWIKPGHGFKGAQAIWI